MIPIIYASIFAASILCSAIYIYLWHKHFDIHIGMIFAFVPIACLGHLLFSLSESMGEAVNAQKIIYLGGSFLQLFILLCIFNMCRIRLNRWIRVALYAICATIFAGALTIGYSDIFYSNISFAVRGGVAELTRDYGPMHTAYYAVVVCFFAAGFAAIVFSWLKKKQVPRTVLLLLLVPYIIVLLSYFLGRKIYDRMDLMPLGYLLAQIMYIIITTRINLYDVADTAIDSMVRGKGIGYITFDFKYRYLGSNETAKTLIPELRNLAVDEVFGYKPAERKIRHFLDSFAEEAEKAPDRGSAAVDAANSAGRKHAVRDAASSTGKDPAEASDAGRFVYTLRDPAGDPDNNRIYNVNVSYLYEDSRKRGYIVTFTDDTANRRYISLLDTYNEQLQTEVDEKTRHITQMHDNLIMSLAMMVESRDNSTGGHIRRTSEGVRIMIDEIIKEGGLNLSEEFCRDVIKAAPMHDLGKIAVRDSVLQKPGRFEPEEFEEMKKHAAEGARVIHEILLNTDDDSFKIVAENVAHYHHERWDGSGYPEGLAGEQIPLEARIMAIADVYDALVSKRVYKEAFDFEKANNIIMEGMGTQFDPGLRSAYMAARPRLEEYYRSQASD